MTRRNEVSPERRAELSALLDGELAPGRAAELRERMRDDSVLAAAYAELERIDRELRALPKPEVSAELTQRMRDRLATERGTGRVVALRGRNTRRRGGRGEGAPPWRRRIYAGVALAATIALVLLLRGIPGEAPERPIAPAPHALPPSPQFVEEPGSTAPKSPLPETPDRTLTAERPPTAPPSATGLAPDPAPRPTPPAVPRAEETRPPAPQTLALQPVPSNPVAPEGSSAAQGADRGARPPTPAGPDLIDYATDEELGLALALEALGTDADDLALLEVLDFVERLEEADLAGSGRG